PPLTPHPPSPPLFPYTTLFRSLDRFVQFHLAAFVLRVGDDDNCFAASFGGELFTARQVDRIIKSCTGDFARADRPRVSAHRSLIDRKSTRLNSSHQIISYAVFC